MGNFQLYSSISKLSANENIECLKKNPWVEIYFFTSLGGEAMARDKIVVKYTKGLSQRDVKWNHLNSNRRIKF